MYTLKVLFLIIVIISFLRSQTNGYRYYPDEKLLNYDQTCALCVYVILNKLQNLDEEKHPKSEHSARKYVKQKMGMTDGYTMRLFF